MKNIAKLTSYGCYLDCDFVTAKYPEDEIHIVGNVAEYVYDLEQKISDLEAKLADKQKLLEDSVDVHEIEGKTNYKLRYELAGANETIEVLKQQLAEKDKEIMEFASKVDLLESEKENLFRTLEEANEEHQDKISFAVEQLEKVKNGIESNIKSIYKRLDDLNIKIVCERTSMQLDTYKEISKEIDNQIKAIKGMEVVC